jgi:DNA polymerase III sliding clamp (beta) subunit (PCNA family)
MLLPKSKIELVAAKNDCRFYLNDPYFDAEGKRLIATNGHVLAIIPVEETDGDVSGPVSRDAIAAARKATKEIPAVSLTEEHEEVLLGPQFKRTQLTQQFPDVDRVIPDVQEEPHICFNPEYLLNLWKALQPDTRNKKLVKLTFQTKPDGTIDPNGSFKVTVEGEDGVGVIMPAIFNKESDDD